MKCMYCAQVSVLCKGNVKTCTYVKQLSKLISKYNKNNRIDDKIDDNDYNSVYSDILNSWHHLLSCHDDDDDFEYIFNLFGGNCILSKCTIIQRHYNNSYDIKFNIRDRRDKLKMNIFDRIHCHYQHGYHLFRFTNKEKKQEFKDNVEILKIRDILKNKRNNLKKIKINYNQQRKRFNTNMGQLKSQL